MELTKLDNSKLIALRKEIEKEMTRRGLALSVGEMGEVLTIRYFNSTPGLSNLQKAPPGTKNVDALSRDGDRYSIKTIQKAKKTGTIYNDEKDPQKQLFEYILVTKLDSAFAIEEIYQFNWKEFIQYRSWDKRMNAWYISCSKKTLSKGEQIYVK